MASKWTRAGVRHKTPKWYWVRCTEADDAFPAQFFFNTDHPLSPPCTEFLGRYGWEAWSANYERTVAPILEPGK